MSNFVPTLVTFLGFPSMLLYHLFPPSHLFFLYSVNEALAVGQAPWEVLGTPGNAKTPFCPPREEAELDEGC